MLEIRKYGDLDLVYDLPVLPEGVTASYQVSLVNSKRRYNLVGLPVNNRLLVTNPSSGIEPDLYRVWVEQILTSDPPRRSKAEITLLSVLPDLPNNPQTEGVLHRDWPVVDLITPTTSFQLYGRDGGPLQANVAASLIATFSDAFQSQSVLEVVDRLGGLARLSSDAGLADGVNTFTVKVIEPGQETFYVPYVYRFTKA